MAANDTKSSTGHQGVSVDIDSQLELQKAKSTPDQLQAKLETV